MKKTFCDFCGHEIDQGNDPENLKSCTKYKVGKGNIRVKVELLQKACDPSYHDVCMHCLIDAVKAKDNREDEQKEAVPHE